MNMDHMEFEVSSTRDQFGGRHGFNIQQHKRVVHKRLRLGKYSVTFFISKKSSDPIPEDVYEVIKGMDEDRFKDHFFERIMGGR